LLKPYVRKTLPPHYAFNRTARKIQKMFGRADKVHGIGITADRSVAKIGRRNKNQPAFGDELPYCLQKDRDVWYVLNDFAAVHNIVLPTRSGYSFG
jgi:hypothetical protein|tara:strand:+ start:414 stop:701 length:288 start_codon:yes stop_codon:yes gene_type:complete